MPEPKGTSDGSSDWKIRNLKDGVQVLAKGAKDLYPLMEKIGVYLRQVSQAAFQNQMFDGKRWPARVGSASRPSVMGAVFDLEVGPSINASRFTPRPALVNTGSLRRSIRHAATAKTVRMFSTMPADEVKLHQEGGISTLPVTQAVKGNLATLLKAQPGLRHGLGFLFGKASVSTQVPARPFLGVPEDSRERIKEMTAEYMQKVSEEAGPASEEGGD